MLHDLAYPNLPKARSATPDRVRDAGSIRRWFRVPVRLVSADGIMSGRAGMGKGKSGRKGEVEAKGGNVGKVKREGCGDANLFGVAILDSSARGQGSVTGDEGGCGPENGGREGGEGAEGGDGQQEEDDAGCSPPEPRAAEREKEAAKELTEGDEENDRCGVSAEESGNEVAVDLEQGRIPCGGDVEARAAQGHNGIDAGRADEE